MSFNDWGVVAIIAVLALAAFLPGPVWAIAQLLRRRVFLVAIVVLAGGNVASPCWVRIRSVRNPPAVGSSRPSMRYSVWRFSGRSSGATSAATADERKRPPPDLATDSSCPDSSLSWPAPPLPKDSADPRPTSLLFGAGTAGAVLALIWVPLMEVDGLGRPQRIEHLVDRDSRSHEFRRAFLFVLVTGASVAGSVLLEMDVLRSAADVALSLVASGARSSSDRRLRDARWRPLRRRTGSMAGRVRLAQSFRVPQLGGRGGGDSLAATEVRM